MMALYGGGRPGSSRRVRLVPVRRSGMDHRAVAQIVLALARQMAAEADETVDLAAVDEVVSTGAGTCAKSERGPSVGRCAVNESVSASPGGCLAGRCSHQRHDGTHHSAHESATAGCSSSSSSDEATAVSSTLGGAP